MTGVQGSDSGRTRLTARGWGFVATAVVLAVLAYSLHRAELLFLAGVAVALPLVALVLVRLQRPRMQARRTFTPLTLTAGRPTTVRVEVQNLAPRTIAASTWSDAIGWLARGTVTGVLPTLRRGTFRTREPRSRVRLTYQLVPPRRGVFELGPFTVTRTGPFGLARSAQLVHRAEPITVVPQTQVLPESGLAIAEAEGSARLVQHRSVGGDHDVTTRTYRTGDALRRVHWRASAHHGELMVRQEEQRSHSETSVLIDTRRSGYRDARVSRALAFADSVRFEWAVEFAGSLVVHLQRSGFVVHLHESAPAQLTSVENTTGFLESLATVQLVETPVPLDTVLDTVGQSSRKPGSMFAILSDADDDLLEGLAARRSGYELAVAFLVCPTDDSARTVLSRAGWRCVVVQPEDSPEAAWLAVVDGGGSRFGS